LSGPHEWRATILNRCVGRVDSSSGEFFKKGGIALLPLRFQPVRADEGTGAGDWYADALVARKHFEFEAFLVTIGGPLGIDEPSRSHLRVATFAAAQILRFLPRRHMSRAVGRLCDQSIPSGLSRVVESTYVRAFGVDMSEVATRPGPYESFDEFFTRPLREGARPIDEAVLVSPADGQLVDAGSVSGGRHFVVKGKPYSVEDLVGGAAEGARYADGSFAVVYLSPRDYHRVHSPVDGQLQKIRSMPGDLFPVNAIGERHVPRLLTRNERVALFVETEALGRVAVVLVGAMIVGRISVTALGLGRVPAGDHELDPPLDLRRGDEVGRFHLGSTVVLLTEKRATFSRARGFVRYGGVLVPRP
jgi:phosphatidylserine decarboxylase